MGGILDQRSILSMEEVGNIAEESGHRGGEAVGEGKGSTEGLGGSVCGLF